MTNKFRLTDDATSDKLEDISNIVQEGFLFKNIKCGYQRTNTKGQGQLPSLESAWNFSLPSYKVTP